MKLSIGQYALIFWINGQKSVECFCDLEHAVNYLDHIKEVDTVSLIKFEVLGSYMVGEKKYPPNREAKAALLKELGE